MSEKTLRRFYAAIRDVPDFPKPGILFRDVTPLLQSGRLIRQAVKRMASPFKDTRVEKVLGIESRGFILGAAVAIQLGAGLVLARKPGKLPWHRRRVDYRLEYGTDGLEIHTDAITAGERVLVVDDVLATGGTAGAAAQAVLESGGAVVGISFLIELTDLGGRSKLPQTEVFSLLRYPMAAG